MSFHPFWQVSMVAHVEDILCRGEPVRLQVVKTRLEERHEVKGRTVHEQDDEVRFLGLGKTTASITRRSTTVARRKAVAAPVATIGKDGSRADRRFFRRTAYRVDVCAR